jgi:hypothetical protein
MVNLENVAFLQQKVWVKTLECVGLYRGWETALVQANA